MLVTEVKTHDERRRLLGMAARLREQAKQHRAVGEALDGYRKERRAAIMEQRVKELK